MGKQFKKKGPSKKAPKNRKARHSGYQNPSRFNQHWVDQLNPVASTNPPKILQTTGFTPTFSVNCFLVRFNLNTKKIEIALSKSHDRFNAPGGSNKSAEKDVFETLFDHVLRETGISLKKEDILSLPNIIVENEKTIEKKEFKKLFFLGFVPYDANMVLTSVKSSVKEVGFFPLADFLGEKKSHLANAHQRAIDSLQIFLYNEYDSEADVISQLRSFTENALVS